MDREGTASEAGRFLIVEDEPDTALLLGAALESRGMIVRIVPDGSHAVSAAIELDPHVAIVDLGLPDMSGIDVGRALRAWAGSRALTIAALTGRSQREDFDEALAAGFDYFLRKPIALHVLAGLAIGHVGPPPT
jgi:DNA-binding response OmpR family regulator